MIKRDDVLWYHRGAAYEARILEVHDQKPLPGKTAKQKYVESSSDDELSEPLQIATAKKQCKTVAVAEEESGDLSDDSKDSDNSLMLKNPVQEKHSSLSLDLASTSSSTKKPVLSSFKRRYKRPTGALSNNSLRRQLGSTSSRTKQGVLKPKLKQANHSCPTTSGTLSSSSLGLKLVSTISTADHEVAPKLKHKRPKSALSNSSLGMKLALSTSPAKTATITSDSESSIEDFSATVRHSHSSNRSHSKVYDTAGNNDLREVLRQISNMGKKLDVIISTINKLSPIPEQVNESSVKEPLNEVHNVLEEDSTDTKFVTEQGVHLLEIRSSDPQKYDLACLTALFTDQELAGSCNARTCKSTKPPPPCTGQNISFGRMC